MSSQILIVDALSNRRIRLHAQLVKDGFEVVQAESAGRGLALLDRRGPEAILVSDNLPDFALDRFCRKARAARDGGDIPIIALVGDTTPAARLTALEAGAADVLDATRTLAELRQRLRSLLRRRQAREALSLRTETNRTLGLAEPALPFETPAHITVIDFGDGCDAARTAADLSRLRRHMVQTEAAAAARRSPDPRVDVYVLLEAHDPAQARDLIGALRLQPAESRPAILFVATEGQGAQVASPLDLGADDLISRDAAPAELALRVDRLARQKREMDRLHVSLRKMEASAYTDNLTGLRSRNYADEYLRKLDRQLAEHPRRFAVLMADMDHFKRINDRHGHAAGDAMLAHVARLLRESLRSADMIARYGGEEFLILLPDVKAEQARKVAERLRETVAATPLSPGPGAALRATISLGVALTERSTRRATREMIHAADMALLRAKRAGRNRIESALPEDFSTPMRPFHAAGITP